MTENKENGVLDWQLILEFKDEQNNLVTMNIKHPKQHIYLEDAVEAMQEIVNNNIVLSNKGYELTSVANVYYYAKEKEYIVSPQQALKAKFTNLK